MQAAAPTPPFDYGLCHRHLGDLDSSSLASGKSAGTRPCRLRLNPAYPASTLA